MVASPSLFCISLPATFKSAAATTNPPPPRVIVLLAVVVSANIVLFSSASPAIFPLTVTLPCAATFEAVNLSAEVAPDLISNSFHLI
jgi:hypothetical protein